MLVQVRDVQILDIDVSKSLVQHHSKNVETLSGPVTHGDMHE